eukprot:TRINITY_DN21670_c0_g1_i1.p1 TRINITY_DN21670_c0_g1~~TRINITY_DN21670_c0_g1_i1.p1  ORF type:complete len:408 (-),score=124.07 TRINITY_DN21670_c0_g1_i1:50-1273(-)
MRHPALPAEELEDELEALQDLSEDKLYHEILRAEESTKELQRARGSAERALQQELGKLSAEVSVLRDRVRVAQLEQNASGATSSKETLTESRRRIAALSRGTQASRFYTQRLEEQVATLRVALKERDKIQQITANSKKTWQASINLLDEFAHKVDEAETVHKLLVSETKMQRGKLKLVANTTTQEYKSLLTKQEKLEVALRETKNAMELKMLLDEERVNDERKFSAELIVNDIAEVQEMTDALEARCQQEIEKLRDKLVAGAEEEYALKQTKAQLDESARSMWSTVCEQRRRHLVIHQRTEEEDIVTAQLEHRTDVLIEELKVLEENVKTLFDAWGQPNATEAQQEQDMMDDLAVMRAKRRAVQHQLAFQLSRRKPLQEALDSCNAKIMALENQLKPVRGLLDSATS